MLPVQQRLHQRNRTELFMANHYHRHLHPELASWLRRQSQLVLNRQFRNTTNTSATSWMRLRAVRFWTCSDTEYDAFFLTLWLGVEYELFQAPFNIDSAQRSKAGGTQNAAQVSLCIVQWRCCSFCGHSSPAKVAPLSGERDRCDSFVSLVSLLPFCSLFFGFGNGLYTLTTCKNKMLPICSFGFNCGRATIRQNMLKRRQPKRFEIILN